MSSVRRHFSLDATNFSLFSQEGEVTSPLISGPACTLRLQFTKYQQSYAPMKFLIFFFFFFFVIPLTIYIQSTELYRSQFMCYIFITCHGLIMPHLAELLFSFKKCFGFLLPVFLNILRSLFIFCINVDMMRCCC